MNVLSLFDGISCGRVALERAGIPVESYHAWEIEGSAVAISRHNWGGIVHHGDVFAQDFSIFRGSADLVIGGSPCTHWSIAQRADCRETESSGLGWNLFSQFIRALNESEAPFFLYENNYSMSDAIRESITDSFQSLFNSRLSLPEGHPARVAAEYCPFVRPIHINSLLVSAQSRNRYYWTNIPYNGYLFFPADRGILLQDILEFGWVDRPKSLCLVRRYAGFQGSESYLCRRYFGKSFGQAVFASQEARDEVYALWRDNPDFDRGVPVESDLAKRRIRPLLPVEAERLQTLPDGYTDAPGVSRTQRIEAIGNGWTVDVIAHLLAGFHRGGLGNAI